MNNFKIQKGVLIEGQFDRQLRADLEKIGGTFRRQLCFVPLDQEHAAGEFTQQFFSREEEARLSEVNLYLLVRPKGMLAVRSTSLNVLHLTIFRENVVCQQLAVEPADNVEICNGRLMLEPLSKGGRRISYVAPEDSLGRILVRNVPRSVAVYIADAIRRRDLFGYCSAVINSEIVEIYRKNQDLR